MSGVPVMVSDGSRVCGRKRRREDKSGRAERDSRNSKSAKSHGNSLSLLGGGAAPREHPPLRQSVTSHPTMKPPGQVGNGENYPPFDGLDRGVASLILRVGTAAAGQGRPSQSHLANSNPRYPAAESVSQNTRCRHSRAEATVSVSPSRSDRDVDRQAQLDQARLQQRHGQVIAQFNPCVRLPGDPPNSSKITWPACLSADPAPPRSRPLSRWCAFACGPVKLSQLSSHPNPFRGTSSCSRGRSCSLHARSISSAVSSRCPSERKCSRQVGGGGANG